MARSRKSSRASITPSTSSSFPNVNLNANIGSESSNNLDGRYMEPTDADSGHERNLDLSPVADLDEFVDDLDISTNGDHYSISSTDDNLPEETGDEYRVQADGSIPGYQFTQEDKALFDQRKDEENNGPDQQHLTNLSKAFKAIPSTIFAFERSIPIDPQKLGIRVRKNIPPPQFTPTHPGMKSKNKKGETKHTERNASDGVAQYTSITPNKGHDHEEEFTPVSFPFDLNKLLLFATVVEPSNPKVKEIKKDDFKVKQDPIAKSGVLDEIKSKLGLSCGLEAEMTKLNLISKGGSLESHYDTPRDINHIGTVIIGLPTNFHGGALIVNHPGGESERFDWGEERPRHKTTFELHWAFLFNNCKHRVEQVTNGSRLTLAYDIFTTEGPDTEPHPASSESDDLASQLKAALKDRCFAVNGCTLAFGLDRSYPIKPHDRPYPMEPDEVFNTYWKDFERRLKGTDAVLYEAVSKCKLEVEFKAAFKRDLNEFHHPHDEMKIFAQLRSLIPDRITDRPLKSAEELSDGIHDLEEQLSTLRGRKGLQKYQVMLVDMPNAMDGLYDIGDGPEGPTPMDRLQVETLNGPKNLVWVDYPSRCVFENHYANEAGAAGPIMSGFALLVKVPAAADRR